MPLAQWWHPGLGVLGQGVDEVVSERPVGVDEADRRSVGIAGVGAAPDKFQSGPVGGGHRTAVVLEQAGDYGQAGPKVCGSVAGSGDCLGGEAEALRGRGETVVQGPRRVVAHSAAAYSDQGSAGWLGARAVTRADGPVTEPLGGPVGFGPGENAAVSSRES